MNIDVGVLWGILQDPAFLGRVQAYEVKDQDFASTKLKEAYQYTVEHHTNFGTMPTPAVLLAATGVEVMDQQMSPDLALSEFLKRKLFRRMRVVCSTIEEHLRANNPEAAYQTMQVTVDDGAGVVTSRPVKSMSDLGEDVLRSYVSEMQGLPSVPFWLQSLSDATRGLRFGSATVVCARPGVGKTWAGVKQALHASSLGYRVLVVSPEMTKLEWAERHFALAANIKPITILKGELNPFQLASFRDFVRTMESSGLYIMDRSDNVSPVSIESAIAATDAQLVVVDSVYALDVPGKDKYQRTDAAVNWTVQVAKRRNVAVMSLHQMNRTSKKAAKFGGGFDETGIAYTDKFMKDYYNVYAIKQTDEMKQDGIAEMHNFKIRRGYDPGTVNLLWSPGDGVFDEAGGNGPVQSTATGYEDDEFDDFGI